MATSMGKIDNTVVHGIVSLFLKINKSENRTLLETEICRFPCYALLRHRRRNRIRLGGNWLIVVFWCVQSRERNLETKVETVKQWLNFWTERQKGGRGRVLQKKFN